jgi:hypothetical protein
LKIKTITPKVDIWGDLGGMIGEWVKSLKENKLFGSENYMMVFAFSPICIELSSFR